MKRGYGHTPIFCKKMNLIFNFTEWAKFADHFIVSYTLASLMVVVQLVCLLEVSLSCQVVPHGKAFKTVMACYQYLQYCPNPSLPQYFGSVKIQLFLTLMHHEVPIFVLGLFCYDLPSNVLVDSQLSMHLEGQDNSAISRSLMLSFLTIDFLDIRTHHTGDIHEML